MRCEYKYRSLLYINLLDKVLHFDSNLEQIPINNSNYKSNYLTDKTKNYIKILLSLTTDDVVIDNPHLYYASFDSKFRDYKIIFKYEDIIIDFFKRRNRKKFSTLAYEIIFCEKDIKFTENEILNDVRLNKYSNKFVNNVNETLTLIFNKKLYYNKLFQYELKKAIEEII